jgi:hypothetical protein
MIDLDAMGKDPWPTWPVDKMELRILVEENEKLRAANVYLCSRVDYLPYCHEIERLRAALRRISHAPHGKVYCADGHEEAVLIARAALEGEKTDV